MDGNESQATVPEGKNWKDIFNSSIFSNKWLVLLSFSFLSCTNAMQWNTFSPVSRLATAYFQVPSINIDAFSFIFFVAYIIFVLPACWVIYRCPLNLTVIIGGGFFNCLGAWLRVIGVYLPISPVSQFYFVFFGQFVASFAQCFILQVPPLISNIYFEPSERALATSFGFVLNQLGIAVSFLLSPLITGDSSDNIPTLLIVNGLICAAAFASLIFLAKTKSKGSTEQVKAILDGDETGNTFGPFVLPNRSFVILVIAYGINMGVFFSLTTLLDQIIGYYKYSSYYTGWFGFSIIIVGLFGAFFSAFVLDKTKKFKEILIIFYCGTALATVTFGLVLNPQQEILVGIFSSLIGFFMSAIMPISFESAIEATFLEMPEELNTGLMMLSSMVFGVIFLVILNQFIQREMIRESLIFLSVSCFVAYLLLYLFEAKYKRYEAEVNLEGEEGTGMISGENSISSAMDIGNIDSQDRVQDLASSSSESDISF